MSQSTIFHLCWGGSSLVEVSCLKTQHSGSTRGQARTSNPLITGPTLYQLSHCAPYVRRCLHFSIVMLTGKISAASDHRKSSHGLRYTELTLSVSDTRKPCNLFNVSHCRISFFVKSSCQAISSGYQDRQIGFKRTPLKSLPMMLSKYFPLIIFNSSWACLKQSDFTA